MSSPRAAVPLDAEALDHEIRPRSNGPRLHSSRTSASASNSPDSSSHRRDYPERIRNEAAFAKLCGVAPQPASSGRTTGRHRLSRSRDRAANRALCIITIVRMRHDEPTRTYFARRTAEGLTKREIIGCLKRCIARAVFNALPNTHPNQRVA
jgi:hypothetical protein